MTRLHRRGRAFTLVELLVVIGLIVLIGALVIYALAKLYKFVKSMADADLRSPQAPVLVWREPRQPLG